MRHGDEYALKKVKYSFLMTFYIYLQIIPSVIAVYEFIRKPKVWHKTPHGFSIKPSRGSPMIEFSWYKDNNPLFQDMASSFFYFPS